MKALWDKKKFLDPTPLFPQNERLAERKNSDVEKMVVGGGATAADSKEDKTGHFFVRSGKYRECFFSPGSTKKEFGRHYTRFPSLDSQL